jgi:hypothetical protein
VKCEPLVPRIRSIIVYMDIAGIRHGGTASQAEDVNFQWKLSLFVETSHIANDDDDDDDDDVHLRLANREPNAFSSKRPPGGHRDVLSYYINSNGRVTAADKRRYFMPKGECV